MRLTAGVTPNRITFFLPLSSKQRKDKSKEKFLKRDKYFVINTRGGGTGGRGTRGWAKRRVLGRDEIRGKHAGLSTTM